MTRLDGRELWWLLLTACLVGLGLTCGRPTAQPTASPAVPESIRKLPRLDPNSGLAAAAEPDQEACHGLAESPGPGQAVILRAGLCARDKHWEEAIASADAAIKAGLGCAELYMIKGRAHEGLDEHEEAEAALLESFKCDPTKAQPLMLLAESAERRGLVRRCESLYTRILEEVDPRFVPARERLVRLYLNTERVQAAVACLAEFARLQQTGPAVSRCQAYLDFKTSKAAHRLDAYRDALGRILAEQPRDAVTHMDLAMLDFARRDYESSLRHVEEALASAPDDLRGRELKALLQTRLLRFEAADETYHDLLRDRPRSLAYQQNLAESAMNRGDYDAAAAMLRAMLTSEGLGDAQSSLTGQLIEALKLAVRPAEAVETAQQWLAEEQTDPVRQAAYLAALQSAGREDDAIEAASTWLAADEKDTRLRLQFVRRLARAKRHVEAQQRLLAWLAETPDDLDLNAELIRVCWQSRDWDSAIALAQAGTEDVQHADQYEEWLCRGLVFARRFDEPVAFYQDRINLLEQLCRRTERLNDLATLVFYRQTQRNVYGQLVATLISAERFAEAEQIVNWLLQPEVTRQAAREECDVDWIVQLRRYLASIYQLAGRQTQAMQQLEEVRALTPTDPGVNNDLGYSWADAGMNLDQAERMVRFALGEQPRQDAYLDSLGWVLYKRGRFEEAVKYLRLAVLQADSADAVIHDHLGDALYRAGQPAEAARQWEKALEACTEDEGLGADAEDRRLVESVRAKLDQMGRGEAVQVSPIAVPARTTSRVGDP